jgi:hypothetical protein
MKREDIKIGDIITFGIKDHHESDMIVLYKIKFHGILYHSVIFINKLNDKNSKIVLHDVIIYDTWGLESDDIEYAPIKRINKLLLWKLRLKYFFPRYIALFKTISLINKKENEKRQTTK